MSARLKALINHGYVWERVSWEIRDADVKGEGMFLTEPVQAGSVVFIARGPVEFGHFEESDCYLYPDWYSVGRDIWIDIQYPYIKINHSCNPNLGIDGVRCFVALRDIQAGEELTFDYSITDDEEDWVMHCSCKETACRNEVRAIQHTPVAALKQSLPYIPPYFRRKIFGK